MRRWRSGWRSTPASASTSSSCPVTRTWKRRSDSASTYCRWCGPSIPRLSRSREKGDLMSALSRRSFLTGLGLSGAGVLMAACGGPGSTASSPTTAGASGSAGSAVTETANFYHWRSEDKAVIDTLAAGFAEKYPGASITQTIDPSDQYQSTAAQKARDGSIGDALTAFRGTQFGQFSDQGIFGLFARSGGLRRVTGWGVFPR